jgi:hypothetical protein
MDVLGVVLCNGYREIPNLCCLPEHTKPTWLRAIRALPPAWLTALTTDEVFEGKEDCLQRLQGWGLFEGFRVVQGRVWKDGTPRWEFKCKLHGTKTLNICSLEPRKLKDKEGKVATDRQRNTMVKAKKGCGFNYLLSFRARLLSRTSSSLRFCVRRSLWMTFLIQRSL